MMSSKLLRNRLLRTQARSYLTHNKKMPVFESDSDAAEANPMKYFYQEEILAEITELQRMYNIMKDEPKKLYNLKVLFPEVVEDEELKALPEPETYDLQEQGLRKDLDFEAMDAYDAYQVLNDLQKRNNS